MKTILFATDFSINSLHAIRYGLELFKGQPVRYILFNAYVDPSSGVTMTASYADVMRELSESMLKKVHEQLVDDYGYKGLKMDLVSGYGDLPFAPRPIIEKRGVDLVILGTSGASGPNLAIFGSSAYSMMKDAQCPVLAVPLQTPIEVPSNIGLASDKVMGGNEPVLAPMFEIAELHGSSIMGVKVLKKKVIDGPAIIDGPDDQFPFIDLSANDPLEGIELAIGEYGIDMLTIIIPQRKLLDRIFHKSVSKQIVKQVTVPILTLHG
nr:putative universal stress protein [uncultured bacterium]